MSRKDYVAVAAEIKAQFERVSSDEAGHAIAAIARGLADVFSGGNSRFDRQRFLAACGLDGTQF